MSNKIKKIYASYGIWDYFAAIVTIFCIMAAGNDILLIAYKLLLKL